MEFLIKILLFLLFISYSPTGRISEPVVKGERVSVVIPQSVSDYMVSLVNEQRSKNGFSSLRENILLTVSATQKACNMRDRNYWAHTSPDGVTPWDFIERAGYNYIYAGENLCRDVGDMECMRLFMISTKGHKENILSPRYKDVGIGRCGVFVVQHFGAR